LVAGESPKDGEGRVAAGRRLLLDRERFERELARGLAGGPLERKTAGRAAMERAALELSGEIGFGQVTVRELVERSGSNRERFYRAYANKEDCYSRAYRAAIDALVEHLLASGAAQPSWPAGMRTALAELARFGEAEPNLARGLIAAPWAAGGEALAKRFEVFERLSRAIDRARRETNGSRHSPPPITADFILGGIEAELLRGFQGGSGPSPATLDALLYNSVLFYFGEAAAAAEVRRLG
jgi:AcrR family transcriptional regulator